MRFPREEWENALKYYQPKPKMLTNQNEPHQSITDKEQDDAEKDNESHRNDNNIQS